MLAKRAWFAYLSAAPLGSSHVTRCRVYRRLGPQCVRALRTSNSARRTKIPQTTINCQRIYPPRSVNRAEILAAATPTVQQPSNYRS